MRAMTYNDEVGIATLGNTTGLRQTASNQNYLALSDEVLNTLIEVVKEMKKDCAEPFIFVFDSLEYSSTWLQIEYSRRCS